MISIKLNPENINSGKKAQFESGEDRYSMMSRSMLEICEKLSSKWDNDAGKESLFVISELEKYLNDYDRILYSSISNYIYGLYGDDISSEDCDEKVGNMQTNILNVFNYAHDEEYQRKISEKKEYEKKIISKIPAISAKLLDHINLACQQCVSLKQTDDEYKEKFNRSINPFKDKLQKEMNAQLLTLVGIFTALSFLLFGGISSLENIFSGIQTVSILKLIILGCVWGLCLVNLIFVFLFCISKMTDLPFSSAKKETATIFQKYPIFWWTNYILISIFIISCVLFYMVRNDMLKWVDNICQSIPSIVFFVVFGMLFIIILGVERSLKKVCDNKEV